MQKNTDCKCVRLSKVFDTDAPPEKAQYACSECGVLYTVKRVPPRKTQR